MFVIRGVSLAVALSFGAAAFAEELIQATLHKMPYCDCCEGHAAHLRENGFDVRIEVTDDLTPLRRAEGVPLSLEGCHTILVGGYVIEGHVSAGSIKRLISERPEGVEGIAMPGMPNGVPGMPGEKPGPIEVFSFDGSGKQTVFAVE